MPPQLKGRKGLSNFNESDRGPVHARLGLPGQANNGKRRKNANNRVNGDAGMVFDARNLIRSRQSPPEFSDAFAPPGAFPYPLPMGEFDEELAAHLHYHGTGDLMMENEFGNGGPPVGVPDALPPSLPVRRFPGNDLRNALMKKRRFEDNPQDLRSHLRQLKQQHRQPDMPPPGPDFNPNLLDEFPEPEEPTFLRITIPTAAQESSVVAPPLLSASMRSRLSAHPSRIVHTQSDLPAPVRASEARNRSPRSPELKRRRAGSNHREPSKSPEFTRRPSETHGKARRTPETRDRSRRTSEKRRELSFSPVVGRRTSKTLQKHREPSKSPVFARRTSKSPVYSRRTPRRRRGPSTSPILTRRTSNSPDFNRRPGRGPRSYSRSSLDRAWHEELARTRRRTPPDTWQRRRSPRPRTRSRSPIRRRELRHSPIRPRTYRASPRRDRPRTPRRRRSSTPPVRDPRRKKSPSVEQSFHSGSSYYDRFELGVSGSESEPEEPAKPQTPPPLEVSAPPAEESQVLNLTTAPRPLDLSAGSSTRRPSRDEEITAKSSNQPAKNTPRSVNPSFRGYNGRSSLVVVPLTEEPAPMVIPVTAASPSPTKSYAFKKSDRKKSELIIDGRAGSATIPWVLAPIPRVKCDYSSMVLAWDVKNDDPRWLTHQPDAEGDSDVQIKEE